MSSSLLAKVTLGALGAGTATTGVIYFGKGFLVSEHVKTTTSIRELLKSVHPYKRLISESLKGDSTEWKATWQTYRDKYKDKDSNPFSLVNETVKSSDANAPSEFMSQCSSISKEHVVDGNDAKYQAVLNYCTRDALINDWIAERNSNKALLSETSEEAGKWKESWQKYKNANTDKEQSKDKWNLSDWGSKHSDADAPESFKKECKKRYEAKTEASSEDDYLNVLNWCTKTV
ncbi:hypothetical protein MHC_01160 [Mycoplasma haemocanis str. Illinois]|uniref:Uncharacterized protein n=1 Tax=Mycoplasma haemocanis (strain Illinois) TaxID=1111676 RepID=H6N626_MYCHN|nr:hypothetical protein [Mycoplasma haemocanis]AEW45098.1 hypothetical protein MHC_01160 [Mycoplasma haemocanis str. Illinois]